MKLVLNPDENARLALLRTMAQKPEIIREILSQHTEGLPTDESLRFRLVTDRGFGSEEAANTFIKALRETVRFAKLDPGQYTPDAKESPMDQPQEQAAALPVPFGSVEWNKPVPVAVTPASAGASTLHVWSLGGGVTVALRASAPLSPKHFKRLSKYVELAAEAEQDDDTEASD